MANLVPPITSAVYEASVLSSGQWLRTDLDVKLSDETLASALEIAAQTTLAKVGGVG